MKVLFSTYPMAFHTPGGGEIQLLAYQKHLPALGVEVALFDQWNPRFLDHDVVHFFSCVGGSSHFCAFVKQLGLPLVISSSLWITEDTRHLYPFDEIRHQFSLADRVIANSTIECETLARVLDLPLNKFAAVLNGVEESFYEPALPDTFRERFGIQGPFVLNVGNIEPRKNQLSLVAAMKTMPDLRLVLVGHQRDPDYARRCLDLGGDQVIYAGPLPHDSPLLRSAYSAADVFCLPSTLETPGLAALEAYAAGCRIAVTEIGSTREYFGDDVAYLDPSDPGSIARAIDEAVGLRCTPERQTDQRRLDWKSVLSPLKDIYAQAIAQG